MYYYVTLYLTKDPTIIYWAFTNMYNTFKRPYISKRCLINNSGVKQYTSQPRVLILGKEVSNIWSDISIRELQRHARRNKDEASSWDLLCVRKIVIVGFMIGVLVVTGDWCVSPSRRRSLEPPLRLSSAQSFSFPATIVH